jgi:hypothetical protein
MSTPAHARKIHFERLPWRAVVPLQALRVQNNEKRELAPMPLLLLSLAIQAALIIHVIRTGRDSTWIWIISLLPGAGTIAYLVIEILPEIRNNFLGNRRSNTRSPSFAETPPPPKTIDPDQELVEASRAWDETDSIENAQTLADAMIDAGKFEEAKQLCQQVLNGNHEFDPGMMFSLARAQHGREAYAEARAVLDDLKQHNPDFESADAHLLYAIATEEDGDHEAAIIEYRALHEYYGGPEPTCRLATLLAARGQQAEAQALYREVVKKSSQRGSTYGQGANQDWVDMARMAEGSDDTPH